MVDLIQPYGAIAMKLIVGMIGILAFLRITGKAQMGQLTHLDTVVKRGKEEFDSEDIDPDNAQV